MTRRDGDDAPVRKVAQQSDMVFQEFLEGLAATCRSRARRRRGDDEFRLMKIGSFWMK